MLASCLLLENTLPPLRAQASWWRQIGCLVPVGTSHGHSRHMSELSHLGANPELLLQGVLMLWEA